MGLEFMEHMISLTHDREGTRDRFCKAPRTTLQDTYRMTPTDQEGVDYLAAGASGSGRINDVCFDLPRH